MGISVHWDNDEQTTLRLDFKPGWTWILFADAMARVHAVLVTSGHKVDLIFSMGDIRVSSDEAALHMRAALVNMPPTLGYVALVTTSSELENCALLLRRIYKHVGERIVTVPTLDGARSALEHPYTLSLNISPARL